MQNIHNKKFEINTLKNQNGDCNSAWFLYFSMQQAEDETEKINLIKKFQSFFSSSTDCRILSLVQLQQMSKIVNLDLSKQIRIFLQ